MYIQLINVYSVIPAVYQATVIPNLLNGVVASLGVYMWFCKLFLLRFKF